MRLRKIVLTGFKSFVDHTSIDLPGDMICIVGPNGCGKSNVIDAVRWVLGEISARHLRGDSMADVIFNGSSTRKPVGQAAVELVFDNAEGRLGERYAAYTDIAVRRQVSRDGTSSYFLNGARCRRRDITDLFMGTGLGPRSYAVIEQGMISRLIEARPEELREYLEEVAGISRYKERRRETENRMRHTREHLERLGDVRDELDKQLGRLDRQARQAERYKVLKAEERVVQSQVLALRWRRLAGEADEAARREGREGTALEAAVAELRRLESDIESGRAQQAERAEAANAAYRGVLEAAAEVARTEESIANLRRQRAELDRAIEREAAALAASRTHRSTDEQQLAALREQLAEAEPRLAALQAGQGEARERFAAAERAMQAWQARWEELARLAQAPSQSAHAERARTENLEERLQRLAEREGRLRAEMQAMDVGAAQLARDLAAQAAGLALAAREAAAEQLQGARGEVAEARDLARSAADTLHAERARQQRLDGALASLNALQEEALGKSDRPVVDWLAGQGLGERARLAEAMSVAGDWQRAVEVVLGERLEAITVDQLEPLLAALESFEAAPLAVAAETPMAAAEMAPDALAAQVQAPACVLELLHGARTAIDLHDAWARRDELAPGAFFVTPGGQRLGRGWLHTPGPSQARDGVLARVERLRELQAEVDQGRRTLRAAEAAVSAAQTRQREGEEGLALQQGEANDRHRRHAAAASDLINRERDLERARERLTSLDRELGELAERRAADGAELAAARGRLGQATTTLAALETERNDWAGARDALRGALHEARDGWQRQRDEDYQLGLQVEGWRTRVAALDEARLRGAQELARLEARCAELQASLAHLARPAEAAAATLQAQLQAHGLAEAALREARTVADAADGAMRALDGARQSAAAAVERQRESLEGARLAAREATVRRDTVREQLEREGEELEAILEGLPEEVAEQAWSVRLEELGQRIARLGAINLAAIDEHRELAERKAYLDAQHADLEEALSTLEAAIVRIDRETRSRFKDTFEKVNRGLSERFPKLFGGGQAYLQMTGEDLLSAGVSVMAQPPGKRNSTIHLLSGGEKALTAVALVFALFDLNPAPFCLLDEVDAPLDDANVSRFGALVKEMSERVQMLVVTHNKTTMEVGQHLLGVTMHEPGVSRLVAVDIDAAVAMVDA